MMKRLDDFSLFFVSCLLIDSCLSFKPAIAGEGIITYSYEELDCRPPTVCAAWVDCTQTCETLTWEDIETNSIITDEFTSDDLRESCLFVCDDQYLLEDVNECHCEYCDKMCSMTHAENSQICQ